MLNYKQIFSIVLSVVVYTFIINFNFALAFVVAIGFHEYGHLWAARKCGYSTGGLYIWPFIGGTAYVTSRYNSYYHKVIISLMGPYFGASLALITGIIGQQFHSPLLCAVAFWMCIINGFNLLPLGMLDGGQVLESFAYSINKKLGIVTLVISNLIGFVLLTQLNSILAAVFAIFGFEDLNRKIRGWNDCELDYDKLSWQEVVQSILLLTNIIVTLYITFYIVLCDVSYKQALHVLIGK